MSGFSSPIQLGLPEIPDALPQQFKGLQGQFDVIYNAIAQLRNAFQDFGGIDQFSSSFWSLLQPSDTILAQNSNRLYVKAFEAIAFGAMVNLFQSGGILQAQNANATNNTKPCYAYCSTIGGIAAGAFGEVIIAQGLCNGVAGLTIGQRYYLSTVNGLLVNVAPVAAGNIEQFLGIALAPTLFYFHEHYWIQH